MIRRLIIRDLALMDRADLEVGPGFTVVTGETGAGKSVLLGALSLLAGNRAAKTIVRKGAEECAVEAELEVEGDRRFDETLKALDLPACDDGLLILKRSVHATKAGRISVNGGSATLTQLQQLGELWIDFHGPGEPQKLMRAETQLEMLDLHAGLAAPLAAYRAGWRQRHELLREAAEAAAAERLSEDEEAFLRSQLEKLDSLDLSEEAIAKLERDHARASRAQELAALLGQLDAGLGADGLGEVLPKLLKAGDDVAQIDADAASLRDRLNSLAAEAEDIRADFARLGRGLSADEEATADLDAQMNRWLEFRRKYGPGAETVREKREALRRRLASQGDVEAQVSGMSATWGSWTGTAAINTNVPSEAFEHADGSTFNASTGDTSYTITKTDNTEAGFGGLAADVTLVQARFKVVCPLAVRVFYQSGPSAATSELLSPGSVWTAPDPDVVIDENHAVTVSALQWLPWP